MPSDFVELSPLMVMAVLGAVVAFGSGASGYLMWRDHKPKLEHAINVAFSICAISGAVSVLCFWLTKDRWLGPDQDY